MKLTVDFSALWSNVDRMGAQIADFSLQAPREDLGDDLLDNELSSTQGVEIAISELDSVHGVLSVRGQQVLLFIPDHGKQIDAVLSGEKEGRKFHVAECSKLEEMRARNRFDRYNVTNNMSGLFKIFGTSYESGSDIAADFELHVCKLCLGYLNYKGYKQSTWGEKKKIYEGFSIGDFLSSYSTLFRKLPAKKSLQDTAGYSDNWKDVSKSYRESVNYCCELCLIDLNGQKNLLHTHHINGNKQDNRRENLKALCVDCHRKQPLHDYMYIRHADMQLINRLRREQVGTASESWAEVYAMADQALEGVLRSYEKRGVAIPEVGYELQDAQQAVVAELELAWPAKKRGIAIAKRDLEAAQALGWTVLSVGDAIRTMNG